MSGARRERLARSRLYFVTDLRPGIEGLVNRALTGGVDMVQLRDKHATDAELLDVAGRLGELCRQHDALFWLNDRPDLALACDADGVHVGQDDAPVAAVREQVGPDMLIGLSTHTPEQLEGALLSAADQLSVGPVMETPTKPGRAAAGLSYVAHAAREAAGRPWFAIGGIDLDNVNDVIDAGATRIVVVRAILDAVDPHEAAVALVRELDRAAEA